MNKICTWCKKTWESEGDGLDDIVTRGTCPECKNYFFASESPVPLSDYLNRLGVPVLVLDDDVRVRGFSEQARALLGKGLQNIKGQYGGDVIECAYARLPGGCGNSEHCAACTIRRTVVDTYETGKSHLKVAAYQNVQMQRHVRETLFLISTEKAGNFVLLKIEEIRPR